MARVRCTDCQSPLEIPDEFLNQPVECGVCRSAFRAVADEQPKPTPTPDNSLDWASLTDQPESPRSGEKSRPRSFDHDSPRRRRPRGPDIDYAEDKVRLPALGLLITGVIGLFIGLAMIALATFIAMVPMVAPNPNARAGEELGMAIFLWAFYGVPGLIYLGISIVMIIGSRKMSRLSNYGLSLTVAIMAVIPCIDPFWLTGLPFGIIALMALNDPEVKDAFDYKRR